MANSININWIITPFKIKLNYHSIIKICNIHDGLLQYIITLVVDPFAEHLVVRLQRSNMATLRHLFLC